MDIVTLLRKQAEELRKQAEEEIGQLCVLGHCAVQLLEKAAADAGVTDLADQVSESFLVKAADTWEVDDVAEIVQTVEGMRKSAGYGEKDRTQFREYMADQMARKDAHSQLVRGHQASYTNSIPAHVAQLVTGMVAGGAAHEVLRHVHPNTPKGALSLAGIAGTMGGFALSRAVQHATKESHLPDSQLFADRAMSSPEGEAAVARMRELRENEVSRVPDAVIDNAIGSTSLNKLASEDICLRLVRGEISADTANQAMSMLNQMGEIS